MLHEVAPQLGIPPALLGGMQAGEPLLTAGQIVLHPPQWFGSVAVSTHRLPQRVGVPPSASHW